MHSAYEVLKQERIEDIHADGTLLRHKKSGARVVCLSCADDNKVFGIGFRTPPKDSTGVAHIIEHTVLCGSEKYPLKDPFVELLKSSLATFLNAMTFPDKTIYPLASCNLQDFKNLMGVYMDAVLKPNIYHTENFFRQEGWHYHLENKDDPLTISGVVYNEMKGAMSSPDDVLEEAISHALYPDSPYGVNSGGAPANIPDLSYEEFIRFHQTFYHPSNSYIYLYGDMDMEERLDWLDAEYLADYEVLEVDSEIPTQAAFSGRREEKIEYPILDDEPTEDNSFLVDCYSIGDYRDITLRTAFDVLSYVLFSVPGAPVKQALLDAGICKDASGAFVDGMLQPFLTITARNANGKDKERFLSVIRETLEKIVAEGLDPKALASGVNYFEFRYREAEFGYPKGLLYGIDSLTSWLYNDDMPFDSLRRLSVYEELKKHAEEKDGWFEELIRKYLLENPHCVTVVAEPKRGLAAEREKELAEKLAAFKSGLSDDEVEEIVRVTAELQAFQEEAESEEALSSLPMLSVADLDKKSPIRITTKELSAEPTVLHQVYETNGIAYLNLLFDTSKVPDELVEYLGVLKSVLGFVSTERYHYGELFHEINANSGGINNVLQAYTRKGDDDSFAPIFMFQSKYLYDKQDFVFDMIREILATSKLDDTKRLREIVAGKKAKLTAQLPAAANVTARVRANSYFRPGFSWQDRTGGIAHFRLIEKLEKDFDAQAEDLVEKLRRLMKIIFRPENLTVSVTAEEGKTGELLAQVAALKENLFTEETETGSFIWAPEQKNEGFATSGQVQYVVASGDFKKEGFAYDGSMNVLRMILNLDYLWTEIRVKGGAYGMGSSCARTGEVSFFTYRDPHLARSLDTFRAIPEYLANFDPDEKTMTKYIIGAIGMIDDPLSPAAKGELALATHYSGQTEADFQKRRDELLATSVERIRAFAPMIEKALAQGNLCVVGSEASIRKHADLFKHTEALIQG